MGGRTHPWTPEEDAALRGACAAGASWEEVARLTGHGQNAAMERAAGLGIEKPCARRNVHAWTEAEEARLAELAAGDMSWNEIGGELGRSGGACAEHARSLGVRKARTVQPDGWTPEEDARLAELRAAGRSYREVAVELGRSHGACANRAADLGLTSPRGKASAPAPAPTAAPTAWSSARDRRLRGLCSDPELSWSDVADAIGAPVGETKRHAKALGIRKVRKHEWSEADDDDLRLAWSESSDVATVAARLGVGEERVRFRARTLGLLRPAQQGRHVDWTGDGGCRAEGWPGEAAARPRGAAPWSWKEGRYVWRHRDEPAAALAAELGRTEEEIEEIVAALEGCAAERKATC